MPVANATAAESHSMVTNSSDVSQEKARGLSSSAKEALKVTTIVLGILAASAAVVATAIFFPEILIIPILFLVGAAVVTAAVYGDCCHIHHHPHPHHFYHSHRYHHYCW